MPGGPSMSLPLSHPLGQVSGRQITRRTGRGSGEHPVTRGVQASVLGAGTASAPVPRPENGTRRIAVVTHRVLRRARAACQHAGTPARMTVTGVEGRDGRRRRPHTAWSPLQGWQRRAGVGSGCSLLSTLVLFPISIIIPRPQGGFMEWKKSITAFKAKLKT